MSTELTAVAHTAPSAVAQTERGKQATSPNPSLTMQRVSSARIALRMILRKGPAVIGFGEYHQIRGGAKASSSLRRFTQELLPLLRSRTSDLLVETWVTSGKCGEQEQRVVQDVDQTTKRPKRTENEILTLIKRSRGFRIRAHILEMSCVDYGEALVQDDVDYDRFLEMTATHMRRKLVKLASTRLNPVKRAVDETMANMQFSRMRRGKRDIVVAYGGSLHNDIHPTLETRKYSYAADVIKVAGDRYFEVDLFVPEYIERDKSLLRNQSWFSWFEKAQSRRHALLIQQAPNAYIIIFRRQTPPRIAR